MAKIVKNGKNDQNGIKEKMVKNRKNDQNGQ